MSPATRIARVLPNVTGLDREFDYLVPLALSSAVAIGDVVRVSLHGRRVEGWIVAFPESSPLEDSQLLPIDSRLSCGPSEEIVELARWAAKRWAGRLRPMLVAATPSRRIPRLPSARHTNPQSGAVEWNAILGGESPILIQRGPHFDVLPLLAALAERGPLLVVTPTIARARDIAGRLRRNRMTVGLVPDEWASAVGGVDVVVGARSAVWVPIEHLAGIVVYDEHDDSLQEERSPTWHAREVAVERASRLGVPCVLFSPIPSVAALAQAQSLSWEETFRWPILEVVDRSLDEQWSRSLVSSRLIEIVRDHALRVLVVHNAKGRSLLLACASCRILMTCEECEGPLVAQDNGILLCRRCERSRPSVCKRCGSSALANLRPGVSKLVDDLLKASGRSEREVCVVTGSSSAVDQQCSLFVGTEAALHRVEQPDVIVFADIDQELRAPRYRASEITASLLVAAARRVGDGRVVVQSHSPGHPLLVALRERAIEPYVHAESSVREILGLPPYGAIAQVKGAGARETVAPLSANMLVSVSLGDSECLVKARSVEALLDALGSMAAPKGSRITVQVDPPRV